MSELTFQSDERQIVTVHTSLLFDSDSKSWVSNRSIKVDTVSGLIAAVFERPPDYRVQPHDLDWRGYTILPGFVDAHTHILLHSYRETPSLNQERDESAVERILRATKHARLALKAGYTTYRDLGTEGLEHADVGLRDSINRGLIPGPRLLVATEPLASSGSYEVRYESKLNGTVVPKLSDTCDGVEGVIAGVRRRIGAGADFIKVYGDYRRRQLRFPTQTWPGSLPIRFAPGGDGFEAGLLRNPSVTMWSQAELNAIVNEARRAGAPVACHAIAPETVIMAAKAGVTTIEHCWTPEPEMQKAMKDNHVVFVPTLAVYESEGVPPNLFAGAKRNLKQMYEMGVQLACGGDTGAFPHGENIREAELMHEAGVPLEDTLRALTLGGWAACGGDLSLYQFGWITKGWRADMVAVEGDPREDIGVLRRVAKVMKDGCMVVEDGRIIEN